MVELLGRWNAWSPVDLGLIADGWPWQHNLISKDLILFKSEIHSLPTVPAGSSRRLMDRSHTNGSSHLASCWVWSVEEIQAGDPWDVDLFHPPQLSPYKCLTRKSQFFSHQPCFWSRDHWLPRPLLAHAQSQPLRSFTVLWDPLQSAQTF